MKFEVMLTKGEVTRWPMLLDMTKDECRKVLRRLELEAYNSVVTVLRAQGSFTSEKQRLLQDLAAMLSISTERHRAEIRLAVNSEKLATIAEHMAGPNTDLEWLREGRRIVPLMPRLVPQTAFIPRANLAANLVAAKNAQLPQPSQTAKKTEIKKEIDTNYTGDFSSSQSNIQSLPLLTPSISNNISSPSTSTVHPPVSSVNHSSVFVVPAVPPSKSSTSNDSSIFVVPPSPSPSVVPFSTAASVVPPSTFTAPAVPSSSTSKVSSNISVGTSSSTFIEPAVPSSSISKVSSNISVATSSSTFTAPAVPSPSTSRVPSKLSVRASATSVPETPSAVPQTSSFIEHPLPSASAVPAPSSSSAVPPPPPVFIVPPAPAVTSAPSLPTVPTSLSSSKSQVPTIAQQQLPSTSNNPTVCPVPISSTSTPATSLSSIPIVLPTSKTSTDPPSSIIIVPAVPSPVIVNAPSSPIQPLTPSQPLHPPCPSTSSIPPISISEPRPPSFHPCSTSTSVDSPSTSVVPSDTEPPLINVPPKTSSISPPLIPVTELVFAPTTTVDNSLTTSSFLSTIPLISIPPATSFPSSLTPPIAVASSTLLNTSLVEEIEIEQPKTTVTVRQTLETSSVNKTEEEVKEIEETKVEEVVSEPFLPVPTLMLPSGMSIQLREGETEKPKKRKRSFSQDVTMPLHKKIITVPLTKASMPTQPRPVTFQAPVKISVNTPVVNRTSTVTQPSPSTSTQKVIIVSNNANTPNTPSILQRSLSIVKSNQNRFQTPQVPGNSLSATKIRPKMVTVPAKCRPRSNSIVIPMSSSIQNIQFKSAKEDTSTVVDSTVKCLAIPSVGSGTTRILPKPSSMLIVNPTSSQKVPIASGGTRLIGPQTVSSSSAEAKIIKPSGGKQAGKPNVVILHKGSVSKGLKITNASKELVNKVLTGKSIPVRHKRPATITPQNPKPIPIATTAGNLILLDLSKDQYNRNSTIAEILQASGILPANIPPPPATNSSTSRLNPSVIVSSALQHVTLPDIGSAAVEASPGEWIRIDNLNPKPDETSSVQDVEGSFITLDGPLEFLNEEESTSSLAVDVKELFEADVEQTETEVVNEEEQATEQQVFSVTTDISENDITLISSDKQLESQPVTSQIIIEAVPATLSSDHAQLTFLPSLNAPVTIQHSDLDASSLPLEEYTSQQIENQGLT